MCGIAGAVLSRRSQTGDLPSHLESISSLLAVRGPDARGSWISPSGEAGFCHRRLSIIDLEPRSDQPMHATGGRYTMVFNGEIYNYQELRQELQAKGHRLLTTSDTEVLLQMYAAYGKKTLDRIRGMYAFAIWDEEAKELFLARGPLGIKPLYYARVKGNFYFSSQVKSLLTIPGIDVQEESAGHVGFFIWGSVPEPYTLYRGIRCLPSGHWLSVTTRSVSDPRSFASPVTEYAGIEPAAIPKSEGETFERLRCALEESVRMHEIADVPVGIFLSAGIDSGVIAGLAAEPGQRGEALTLGFDVLRGTEGDEAALAGKTARQYGIPHAAQYIDKTTFHEHQSRLLEQMDQPTIDGINVYFISWLARQRGYKVALSGLGGDELFGGYPSFRQIPRTVDAVSRLRGSASWGKTWRVVTAPLLRHFTSPKYASLFEYGGTPGGAYLLRRGLFMPWELPHFLNPDMVREGWRELASVERMNALLRPLEEVRGIREDRLDFFRISALELSFYMRNQLLRDADWAGMAHSIEIRVPFADLTLLRQAAPLLATRFLPQKVAIVRTLRKPLPPEILNRPKSGFVVPVREWMQDTPDRGLRHWAAYVYGVFCGTGAKVAHPGPRIRTASGAFTMI